MKAPARSSIIMLVAALAVGAGTGAGIRILRKPHAAAAEKKPAAPEATEAHKPVPPAADSVSVKDSTHVVPVADTAHKVAATADTTHTATPPDTSKLARRDRLAKMFAGMEPRDAAHVLEQMQDDDVVAVLGAVREKQAAAILSQFQPKRAAAVTRSLLLGSVGRT